MKKKSRSCANIQIVKSSQAWRIEAIRLSKQLKIVRARSSHKSLHQSSRSEESKDVRCEKHPEIESTSLEEVKIFVICYTNFRSIVQTRNLCVQVPIRHMLFLNLMSMISSILSQLKMICTIYYVSWDYLANNLFP